MINTKRRAPMIAVVSMICLYLVSCTESTLPQPDMSCSNTCGSGTMLIGCDDRQPRPVGVDSVEEEPFSFIGRFDGGSQCSGTLIDERYVLTAAHCLFDQGSVPLGFSPAQTQQAFSSRPLGTYGVRRVYIPGGFSSNQIESEAAYDLAVAELYEPVTGVSPANWGHTPLQTLRSKPVYTAGYPAAPPDGSTVGRAWITGGQTLHLSQPFGWINDGELGLLYSFLDGTRGQSGSPIYSFLLPSEHDGGGIIRRVSGVLIGSPVQACQSNQNWVVRLTPGVVEHIQNLIDPGVFDFWWRRIDLPFSNTVGPGDAWP